MEQVTITVISPGKTGTTNGKEWSKLGIQVEEKGDTWINGFANKITQGWTVGSIVNLALEEDAKWGWQFKVPNAADNLEARVAVLEESVNALLRAVPSAVVAIKQDMQSITDPPSQADEEEIPNPGDDDLPF